MPDEAGLGRTRADDGGKRQTFRADAVIKHDAEFPFEHLPHALTEGELIHLFFDRRFLAAQHASHKPTVAD